MKYHYSKWIDKNIAKEHFENKNVFITGGNSGIGFELARHCAYLGANLFLLCRNEDKAKEAKEKIIHEYPNIKITLIHLDLGNLCSIQKAVEEIKKYDCDMFINNAGVYHLPKGYKTKDDLEITMGTNFIGTYYLNKLLLPYLTNINHLVHISYVSSITTKNVKMNFNDMFMEKSYNPMKQYARSKVGINYLYLYETKQNKENANLCFSLVHPGGTYTPLIEKGYKNKIIKTLGKGFMKIVFHTPEKASLSLLKGLDENTNCKIGPRGLMELSGFPHTWKIKINNDYLKAIECAEKILQEKIN